MFPSRKRPLRSLLEAPHKNDRSSPVSCIPNGCSTTVGLQALVGNFEDSSCSSSFFTFRMEHRRGNDERRLLLFRSDLPGAVGKIVYSSRWDGCQRGPVATVHVLSVKEEFRGLGLGELLFTEAMNCLRRQYSAVVDVHDGPVVLRVMLDAEEDARRHNKLVRFYERLGCVVKDLTKVGFINNNDGEVYRKVPMHIDLTIPPTSAVPQLESTSTNRTTTTLIPSFLPLSLVMSGGWEKPNPAHQLSLEGACVHFILVQTNDGGSLQIQTTRRETLTPDHDGRSSLIPASEACAFDHFNLIRASQCCFGDDDDGVDDEQRMCDENELWMLQSAKESGLYLDSDGHTLLFSKEAAFWEAVRNSQSSSGVVLVKSDDTPWKRNLHHRMRSKQTVEYVQMMRRRHLRFEHGRMTLKAALDAAKSLPLDISSSLGRNSFSHDEPRPSLRTLMFLTAELARNEGHPDWVQFVGMIYGLAGILKLFRNRSSDSHSDYDWTLLGVESHVISCRSNTSSSSSSSSSVPVDENILLSWSSFEYMYYLLKHNNVLIPHDAYTILKFGPLVEWHSRGGYTRLTSELDEYSKCIVADFSSICQRAQLQLSNRHHEYLSDEDCLYLWDSHYSLLFQKYGADHVLKW